eukprot:CAMPEP_0170326040 /NCGR_PEP_ID=MMETSP0116_2-20130129/63893_1 /TAXON_ID=400756 /ORGANISM="Durinskia baltica, Strain CSIRO CS-38" /LENGTH=264 /DNA_ID=CAMNT_0010579089 /DNA_START=258 /DNA_END=1050 /DNA_ORIENTATION=-
MPSSGSGASAASATITRKASPNRSPYALVRIVAVQVSSRAVVADEDARVDPATDACGTSPDQLRVLRGRIGTVGNRALRLMRDLAVPLRHGVDRAVHPCRVRNARGHILTEDLEATDVLAKARRRLVAPTNRRPMLRVLFDGDVPDQRRRSMPAAEHVVQLQYLLLEPIVLHVPIVSVGGERAIRALVVCFRIRELQGIEGHILRAAELPPRLQQHGIVDRAAAERNRTPACGPVTKTNENAGRMAPRASRRGNAGGKCRSQSG